MNERCGGYLLNNPHSNFRDMYNTITNNLQRACSSSIVLTTALAFSYYVPMRKYPFNYPKPEDLIAVAPIPQDRARARPLAPPRYFFYS